MAPQQLLKNAAVEADWDAFVRGARPDVKQKRGLTHEKLNGGNNKLHLQLSDTFMFSQEETTKMYSFKNSALNLDEKQQWSILPSMEVNFNTANKRVTKLSFSLCADDFAVHATVFA